MDLAHALRHGRLEVEPLHLETHSVRDHVRLHTAEEIPGDQAQRLLAGVHLHLLLEPAATTHGAIRLGPRIRSTRMMLLRLEVLFSARPLPVQCTLLHQEPTRLPRLPHSTPLLLVAGEPTLRRHLELELPHQRTTAHLRRLPMEHQRLLLRRVPGTLTMTDWGRLEDGTAQALRDCKRRLREMCYCNSIVCTFQDILLSRASDCISSMFFEDSKCFK